MRNLTQKEQNRLKILTQHSVSFTLIEPTYTGLKKGIMDAIGSVRYYLKSNNFHDYSLQKQGTEHKIIIDSWIYQNQTIIKSKGSLYRPKTKKGDPRIWFYGLKKYAKPNDILVIIGFEKKLHIINLTQLPIKSLIESVLTNPLKELIKTIEKIENEVAKELLFLLEKVANSGFVPSMVNADTAVGRTLERILGIPINSSKQPDYKGIELKAFRGKKNARKNLFAQVPNWKLSKFKSSAEILNTFGYWRDDNFKLYCTVSTLTTNSQGLRLKINTDLSYLIEYSDNKKIGDFVIWTLAKLHQRLLEKHRETFWITASSKIINGKEHFQYTNILHTKKPILSQFDVLLEQGIITIDHLIKKNPKGRIIEKGPLFKIKPNSISLLFPPSKKYNLLTSSKK